MNGRHQGSSLGAVSSPLRASSEISPKKIILPEARARLEGTRMCDFIYHKKSEILHNNIVSLSVQFIPYHSKPCSHVLGSA